MEILAPEPNIMLIKSLPWLKYQFEVTGHAYRSLVTLHNHPMSHVQYINLQTMNLHPTETTKLSTFFYQYHRLSTSFSCRGYWPPIDKSMWCYGWGLYMLYTWNPRYKLHSLRCGLYAKICGITILRYKRTYERIKYW